MKKMELMAPAGNLACVRAALDAGADSIYFGLKEFNARAAADNFDEEELKKAVALIHGRKAKAYLTLNILIKEHEMDRAQEDARRAVRAGIDAVIVQDIGLGQKLIQSRIPVIASTQMTIGNHLGVLFAGKLGYKRVVLARELDLDDVRSIGANSSGIELECFAHGGLCISYSGQCSASCVLEHAAANRGICRTPCWEEYTLYKNGERIRSGRLIKPKDMFGLERLKELADAGVSALKIQGRTRSEAYVRNVVSVYRSYVDLVNQGQDFDVKQEDLERLAACSPRGMMRGNLEKTANCNFVVGGACGDIPIPAHTACDKLQTCEIPRSLTLKLNDIRRIDPDVLEPLFSRIYLPYEAFVPENQEKIAVLSEKAPLYVVLPILFERHLQVYDEIPALIAAYPVSGLSLSNISDLALAPQWKLPCTAESSFHITNHAAAEVLTGQGVEQIVLPLELSGEECRTAAGMIPVKTERIIYGRPPLMQMKYCIIRGANECPGDCCLCEPEDTYILAGMHTYLADVNPCRTETTLYSMKKTALPVLKDDVDALRLECTDESSEQINTIAKGYLSGYYPSGELIDEIGSL